jgi:hypothetical protein
MNISNNHHRQQQTNAQLKRHAVLVQRKMAALVAFSTTIFLLCIENVKAFTTSSPLSLSSSLINENTMIMFASGAHTLAKRWKSTSSTLGRASSRSVSPSSDRSLTSGLSVTTVNGTGSGRRFPLTTLRMAIGIMPSESSMQEMKTSIGAFGGWYNKLDPVARPPVYEDDITDYSFTSPSDNWPSSLEDDDMSMMTSGFTTSSYTTASRKSTTNSTPRPFRTIRRIAGRLFGNEPRRQSSGAVGMRRFL